MKLTKKALKLTRVTGVNSLPTHDETRPVLIDIYKTLIKGNKDIEIILLTSKGVAAKSFSEIKKVFETNETETYNNLLEEIKKVKAKEFLAVIVVTVKISSFDRCKCIGLSIIEKPTPKNHEAHKRYIK